jgi:hypothetical protein
MQPSAIRGIVLTAPIRRPKPKEWVIMPKTSGSGVGLVKGITTLLDQFLGETTAVSGISKHDQ